MIRLRRDADALWLPAGGPAGEEYALQREAHCLLLCHAALQACLSGTAAPPNTAGSSAAIAPRAAVYFAEPVDERASCDEADPLRPQLPFAPPDAHLEPAPDGRGFRTLRRRFLTRHASLELRASAVVAMLHAFSRGGQTALVVLPELAPRLAAAGKPSVYGDLIATLERMRVAAAADSLAASGGRERRALEHCGALLVRLLPPEEAADAAPATWRVGGEQPYWAAHVDQHNASCYDVSAVLYLSSQGVDFTGGSFSFHDPDGDRTLAPSCGDLITFSSTAENPHSVARVKSGARFALLAWFTYSKKDARPLGRQEPGDSVMSTAPMPVVPIPLAPMDLEQAALSATLCSLASNDSLRTRLLNARAQGRSIAREMSVAEEEGGALFLHSAGWWAGLGLELGEDEAPDDTSEDTGISHRAQPNESRWVQLDSLRAVVASRAALCRELHRRRQHSGGTTGTEADRGNARSLALTAAAAEGFSVFDAP